MPFLRRRNPPSTPTTPVQTSRPGLPGLPDEGHRASRRHPCRERGTTTAEYAIGTLAACAFAAVLYKILTGGSVAAALGGIVHKALGLAG